MASKRTAKATPDPTQELTALTASIFTDGDGLLRSNIVAVKANVVALVAEDGQLVEKPMGTVQAAARTFKTGSRGFYLNGKLTDPSEKGLLAGTKFQLGGNVIAVKSKEW